MSDPLSQREIEDVLSSIRRLVSHEVARAKSERLILTPALRVVGDGPHPNEATRAAPAAECPADHGGPDLQMGAPRAAPRPEAETPATAKAAPSGLIFSATPRADPGAPVGETPTRNDADALRAVIADVLREELRGTLGERMTRNIRKLVRAEVARAMAERG